MSRRPFDYGWLMVVTLGVTETISWGILYYSFSVFLAPMEADLGASRGAMSGAFSAALLAAGIAAVPVGRWLDRRGPRLLMTGGSIAGTLLVVAWSRVESLVALYVVWIAIGLTLATVLYDPAFAVIAKWFERNRLRALTVVTLMAGFASTIFIPLAGWLIELQGWRDALIILAVILGAGTILPHALVLRRAPLQDPGSARAVRAPLRMREVVRGSTFRWLALALWLASACTIGVSVHLVPILGERGYDPGSAAALAGMVGAMQVVARLLVAPVSDGFAPHHLAAVVLGLQPLALLALLLVPGIGGVLAFVALFGASRGLTTVVRPGLVAGLYGTAQFAMIAGVLQLLVSIAQAGAPLAIGVAYDVADSYIPILWVMVGVSAAAAVTVLAARPPSGGASSTV